MIFWGVEQIWLQKPLQAGFRSMGGSRAAQEPPRVTPRAAPGSPRTGQGAAQDTRSRKMILERPQLGAKRAAESPKKGPGEAQHRPQEDTRAEKPRQEDTSGDKITEDKTRGKARKLTDKRSSGATKPRTPWPVSNLLLVHLMHGSTLVCAYIRTATRLRRFCGLRRHAEVSLGSGRRGRLAGPAGVPGS